MGSPWGCPSRRKGSLLLGGSFQTGVKIFGDFFFSAPKLEYYENIAKNEPLAQPRWWPEPSLLLAVRALGTGDPGGQAEVLGCRQVCGG